MKKRKPAKRPKADPRVRLRDHIRWAQRLQGLTARLSEAVTPQEIADAVLDEARAAFRSNRATVSRVRADGEAMQQLGSFGFSDDEATAWRSHSLRAGGSPTIDVLTAGRPLFCVSRASLARQYPEPFVAALESNKIEALATLPVMHSGGVRGILELAWRRKRDFSADDKQRMLAFASQIGDALERAHLHEASAAKSRVIKDLLSFARIKAGRAEYDMRPVNVREIVTDVLEIVEADLAAAGLTASTSFDDAFTVAADPDKLQQILLNLLSNAIKFTDRGGRVSLDVPVRPALPDDAVFLRVADTGCGIPRSKQDMIFEPFVQAHKQHRSKPATGLGLGLAISRDLARGMGGDLRVRSEEGKGSSFTLTLQRYPE
jgi:signal transduction histidine kinase